VALIGAWVGIPPILSSPGHLAPPGITDTNCAPTRATTRPPGRTVRHLGPEHCYVGR